MKEIWTSDEATYHGEHVDFDRIWCWPKPLTDPHPPIIVGGHGKRVLDRVLAFGDEWMPNRIGDDAKISARIARLRAGRRGRRARPDPDHARQRHHRSRRARAVREPAACTGRCSGSGRATSPTSSGGSTGWPPGSRPTRARAERLTGWSELRGVELEPEQRAPGELPGRRRDQHVLGRGVHVAEAALERVRSRRSRCRRRATRRRRPRRADASTAWVAASRRRDAQIDRDLATGPRRVPGALDRLEQQRPRPPAPRPRRGRRPDWVAARSASLRVLRVGVLAPASAPRSSSAPRAIPSATAAIDAASRPNGGNAYSGPGSRGGR